MAVHERFESWYISLPSSAKQQREETKFYAFWRTRTAIANFWYPPCFGIDNFTVVCLVTSPLDGSEAGVDLVLIQTSLLLFCKTSCSGAN